MKTIRIQVTNKEFALLVQAKNWNTWHDFILKLLKGGENGNNNCKKS